MHDDSVANVRLEARFHGRVQGVAFRYFTARQAEALGVTGWVRNLPDGTVQLVAEGPRSSLEALLDACRQGPPLARVRQVDADWKPPQGDMGAFEIRY